MGSLRAVRLIIPLISSRPTGMGRAGLAARKAVEDSPISHPEDRWFTKINDLPGPGIVKMLLRLLLCQLLPLIFRRDFLVFASHHAPLFPTGRHAMVIHDLIPLRFPEQNPWQTLFFQKILPWQLKACLRTSGKYSSAPASIISVSVTTQLDICRFFPFVSDKLIRVIPSGSSLLISPESKVRSFGVPSEKGPVLLMVGAGFRHKGLEIAMSWLKELQVLDPRYGLVVTGCREEIWSDILPARQVTTHSWVSDDDLDQLYEESAAVLYPTQWEGLGLPPLEALARNKPVFTLRIPAVMEVCGSSVISFPVDANPRKVALDIHHSLTSESGKKSWIVRWEEARQRLPLFSQESLNHRWQEWIDSIHACRPDK